MPPLLELDHVDVFHGDLQAVFDVSLRVHAGEVLALIGANGAGKSTLLCAPSPASRRRGAAGCGCSSRSCRPWPAERIAALGIAMVPEGRLLFPSLTVEENLQMGGLVRRARALDPGHRVCAVPGAQGLPPAPRHAVVGAGSSRWWRSDRALMANPRLLLCDELSLGLAPVVVEEIYRAFARIRGEGLALVLVEQNVERACAVSDRVVCLLKGRVTLAGSARGLPRERIAAAYFGD